MSNQIKPTNENPQERRRILWSQIHGDAEAAAAYFQTARRFLDQFKQRLWDMAEGDPQCREMRDMQRLTQEYYWKVVNLDWPEMIKATGALKQLLDVMALQKQMIAPGSIQNLFALFRHMEQIVTPPQQGEDEMGETRLDELTQEISHQLRLIAEDALFSFRDDDDSEGGNPQKPW